MSDKKTVTVTIDGKKIEAPADRTILSIALEHGIKIPYFCYHPDLRPDGNCRMCVVEVEKIKKPVISCMTYPTEGMVVRTNSEKILAARKAVLEFILVNHPLDCPICDKVGECELQANYFDYSGRPSHFKDPYAKVRAPKLERFSERIVFDSERCIKCGRCVRFTQEVSKSYGLGLVDRGVHSTVAATPEFEKDLYSDCVADICPVGALTKTRFRFKARVYMLKRTASVCPLCSRGCNIQLCHKKNKLNKVYRVMPRCTPAINKSWMCNAGRDLGTYLDREKCRVALESGREIPYREAVEKLTSLLQGKKKILAVASTFGSDEEISGFVRLFKDILGAEVCYKTDSVFNRDEYPADDLLITGDKNPNRHTLEHYRVPEISTMQSFGELDLLVVWGEGLKNSLSGPKTDELFAKAKAKVLVSPFPEETHRYDLIIPARTFVEKCGTFTNVQGQKSRFNMAFVNDPDVDPEVVLWEKLALAALQKQAC